MNTQLKCWLILCYCCSHAAAEDTITLISAANANATLKVVGTVIDYTGRELTVELPGGNQQKFPGAAVIEIATTRSPDQQAAEALYTERKYAAATTKFYAAIDREKRRWVRRQLLARLVACHAAQGQMKSAGELFLGLVKDDPTTPHFAVIPLAWLPGQATPEVEQQARQWLAREDSPIARLLGASHLMLGPQQAAALDRLKQLATSDDPRIAALAEAQVWRGTFTTASDDQLAVWSRRIDGFPTALRAGPYLVVGRAWAYRGRHETAAMHLLRVPILYPQDRQLAAEALALAAGALDKQGQAAESRRLYRELVTAYPESRQAAAANASLEESR